MPQERAHAGGATKGGLMYHGREPTAVNLPALPAYRPAGSGKGLAVGEPTIHQRAKRIR